MVAVSSKDKVVALREMVDLGCLSPDQERMCLSAAREIENLRALLREALEWNWIDLDEMLTTEGGRAEAKKTLPHMLKLQAEISKAITLKEAGRGHSD